MTNLLFDPPPKYGIPLSRGGDIYLSFTLTVPELDGDGDPIYVTEVLPDGSVGQVVKRVEVDFPAGSTLTFAIATGDVDETGFVQEVSELAEISGSKATMLMDHLKLDGLSFDENRTWRLTYTSAEGVDSPVANGWTYRADGEESDEF